MTGLNTLSAFWVHVDWSMVSAFAALMAALVAIITISRQESLTHFSVGIELLYKLEDAFTTDPKMLAIRATAANALLSGNHMEEVDDVLDFFQTAAFLHHRKIIDAEMLWTTFDPWLRVYWYASTARIQEYRKFDPTAWLHVDKAFKAIVAMQARMAHTSVQDALPTPKYVKQFLTWETELADPLPN